MAFQVGAIVSELQLRKDKWDQSIKAVKKDQESLSGLILRNSQQIKKMGRNMTIAGGAIVGAIGLMVKASADFDQAMTESLAIMGDVSDEMKGKMAAVARTISTETVYSAEELAAAYFYLASAGMNVEQSMAALLPVAQFAQAGTFDLAIATDLLTDAQTALGLSSNNAIKNQENLIRVSDVLVGANTLANASVEQFAEALTNKAAAAMVNLNMEVEEGVAVLAAYADKGVKGQLAGQRLTMMLNGLFDASRRNKGAWDAAGVSLFKADGSFRKVAGIIQDLEGYLGAMTVQQREAALATLGFNIKTKDSILTLMGSSEKMEKWTEDLKDMGGITERVAGKQLETFNNQLKLLKNTITDAAIEIGDTLLPMLQKFVINAKDVVEGLTDWIEAHPTLTEYITKSALAVGSLLLVLGPLTMMLPGLVTGFGLLGPAIGAMLGPIGLVAGGIGLLAAGIVVLFQDALREEKKWLDNSVLINAALDDMSVSMEGTRIAAGLSVKEWEKLTKSYKGNNFELARAIEKGELGLALQDAQIKSTREIREAKRAQEETEKALTEATELLDKGIKKQTESMDLSAETQEILRKATELLLDPELKLAQSYADGTISLLEYTSKMRELREERKRVADDLGDLELAEEKIVLVLEEQENVLFDVMEAIGIMPPVYQEAADDIDTSWTNLNEKIEAEWISTFSSILRDLDNFDDTMDRTVDAIEKMFADTIAAIVVDWVLGTQKMAAATAAMTSPIGLALVGIGIGFKFIFDNFIKMEESTYDAVEAWEEARERFDEFTSAMGADLETFDDYYQSLERVLDVFLLTGEQIATIWDRDVSDVMRDFIHLLKETGREGDAAFIQLILRMREAGLEIRSLTEYIQDQLGRIPDALSGLIAPAVAAGDAVKTLEEKLAEQNEELTKLEDEGGEAYNALSEEVNETKLNIASLTNKLDEQQLALAGMGDVGVEEYRNLREEIETTEAEIDSLGLKLFRQKERLAGLEEGSDAYNVLAEKIALTEQAIEDADAELSEQLKLLRLISDGAKAYIELEEEIKNTQEAILDANETLQLQLGELAKLAEGTEEYNKLRAEIELTKAEIAAATEKHEEHRDAIERAGILALATFNAMREEGISYYDVVQKMKDPLIALRDQYDALGLDANAALGELFRVIGVTEAHGELFEAIDANKVILEALRNTGWLTQEALSALAGDAADFYNQLIAAGLSSEEALRLLKPQLEIVRDHAEEYELKIDDATQALIDNAEEMGILAGKAEDPAAALDDTFKEFQRMFMDEFIPALKDTFEELGDKFELIMDAVATDIEGTLEGGFANAFDQAKIDADIAAANIGDTMDAKATDIKRGIESGFADAFNSAETAAEDTAENIGLIIGAIKPDAVKVRVNWGEVPDWASGEEGKFEWVPGKKGEEMGGFRHGGAIEAGPYRPTALVFGEGPERERAVISHIGEGSLGERDINIKADFNVENLTVRSDEDIERIKEAFKRNLDGLSEEVAGHLKRFN